LGEAEVIIGVMDDVLVVALAAVAREEAGAVVVTVSELWMGGEVLAAVGAWVWLWLLQGGMALQSCVVVGVASVSIGVAVTEVVSFTRLPVVSCWD